MPGRIRPAVLAAVILFVLSQASLAANISVTSVKISPGNSRDAGFESTAEITINGAVRINGIKVSKISGITMLKFPEYVSLKKKAFPQVRLISKEANETVRKAIESGTPSETTPEVINFRISSFRSIETASSLKAVAKVIFNDSLEIECRVLVGSEGPWVGWPSTKTPGNGRWKKLVIITDYDLRESVERSILDRFNKTR